MIPAQPKIFWSLLFAAGVAGAARAQGNVCDYEFDAKTRAVLRAQREHAAANQGKAAAAQKAAEAGPGKLFEARVGMRDAVGVGAAIDDYLTRHPNISLEFDAIRGISSRDQIGGSVPLVTLRINKDLPRTPRVLSVAIANEAFDLMYEQMPECAEKAYMHASVVARTWVELGGDKDRLPVIEPLTGYANAEMAAILSSWLGKPSHQAQIEIGKDKKLKSLQELLSENQMEIGRLEPFYEQDREHEYRSHHSDPSLEKLVRQYHNAVARQKELEKGEKIYTEFMTGVEYKDSLGHSRFDNSGEMTWRDMYKGRH